MAEGKDVRRVEGGRREAGGGKDEDKDGEKVTRLGLGEFWGFGVGRADKEDILVAGPAALVSLFDLFHQPVPSFRGKHFWGFPGFGALLFSLPPHFAGKEGDAVGGFCAVAFRLFRPFDGAAHAGKKIRVRRGRQIPGRDVRLP